MLEQGLLSFEVLQGSLDSLFAYIRFIYMITCRIGHVGCTVSNSSGDAIL